MKKKIEKKPVRQASKVRDLPAKKNPKGGVLLHPAMGGSTSQGGTPGTYVTNPGSGLGG
jgi:hypothetical protein